MEKKKEDKIGKRKAARLIRKIKRVDRFLKKDNDLEEFAKLLEKAPPTKIKINFNCQNPLTKKLVETFGEERLKKLKELNVKDFDFK